ncbi:hypothetical protein [Rufibacter hautae]|uniref:Uncharacterized protein n=1 Tax=Rufibacter hautae TaxID=2595005 RepID=A0A5B6TJD7_9BACT|nr:hypothetical protein [Rufibacter hautae]KAA3440521.1 hypothetical protein FOA19_07685 [Rufibacter hautae]
MKPSSTILIFLFLTISTVGFCQDYKKLIEKQFISYNSLIIAKEFEKSMDYVPTDVFELVPKAQMIKAMEMTFNNSEMEFELNTPEIIEISDAEKIGNRFYSHLHYSSLMKIKLKSDNEEETKDEQTQRMNLTKMGLQQAFGFKNVLHDEKTGFYEIVVEKQAYAISVDGKTDWKFLVVEKKQKPFLDKLLPNQLIDKI